LRSFSPNDTCDDERIVIKQAATLAIRTLPKEPVEHAALARASVIRMPLLSVSADVNALSHALK